MTNFELYANISNTCSINITKKYSTSFYSAIKLLHKDLQKPICNIYGFVRLADEIVDTFHEFDKATLLNDFIQQTNYAIDNKISLNPILFSFQETINQYQIDKALIDAFLYSMQLDLSKSNYTETEYQQYIYGSAEVVGLMCLKVFCNGNNNLYLHLIPSAKKLGAAFQKINFLRDIKTDNEALERMYFPNCNFNNFTLADKLAIEKDIEQDFASALIGIKQLPSKAKFGVYVAYQYYVSLFKKIKKTSPKNILQNRIRVSNYSKAFIVANAGVKYKLNIL